MIIPFALQFSSGNTPQRPLSTTDNTILAGLIADTPNTLATFGLTPPLYAYRLSGLRFEASAACTVNAGMYNGVNFYTLWTTQAPQIQYTQVQGNWSYPDGLLPVQVGNGYVLAFKLATGASVLLTGELKIANINIDASANTLT